MKSSLSCSYTIFALLLLPCLMFGQGPVLSLKFDGESMDHSGNGAEVLGPVRYTTDWRGTPNSAAVFHPDHYDDLLIEGQNDRLLLQPPLSFSLWLRPDNLFEPTFFLSTSDSARIHGGITLQLDGSGAPILSLGDGRGGGSGNRFWYIAENALPQGTWSHLAYTLQPNGTAEIYIDGVRENLTTSGSASPSSLMHLSESFKIGQKWEYFFTGAIDEVYMYDRILTQAEILDLSIGVVGTEDPPAARVAVFPNASSTTIKFDASSELFSKVRVVDSAGKATMLYLSGSANELDISGLTAGLYFAYMLDGEGQPLYAEFLKL